MGSNPTSPTNAPLAKMANASALEAEYLGFESLAAHQNSKERLSEQKAADKAEDCERGFAMSINPNGNLFKRFFCCHILNLLLTIARGLVILHVWKQSFGKKYLRFLCGMRLEAMG